ncbi:4-(cytidine 5'-diphospho)-2-C-methyl-D-erythritol kinase [Endomicrobium proavitum]|uniref:4-diphosphocytidyl-2-C-methyl-D-erythritol kinase n=1 Tax=Endomicrobium proavitum TaxID=1408281 RepID=A0A0G3WM84_9BACT|nr:4-(cytidine 5'-diphospho)-2-C-methyl-D-erythritol kinase [Endomicrobium proavitum]AKL98589.1 4-diphosphocytidyl-2-C-methyl-D-erythritol kinase [Endomicrobium proavitum]
MKINLKAPAKVNLFLEITGKRPDGYHNLETIMQTISLYDELSFELSESAIELECSDKNLASDESNIVFKAAKVLKERYGVKAGVKIFLKKEIPTGAGLGGGSSDAAAALKALVKIWKLNIEKEELQNIASKLGADVPFFLTGGTALCEAIGDIVTPLKAIEGIGIVLVNPGFGVPTAGVYKKIKFPLTNQRKINKIKTLICDGSFNTKDAFDSCFNRLEEFVLPDYPQIAEIKQVLTQLGCASLMSGSGATVYGIFESASQLKNIQFKLSEYPWKTWTVHSVL